MIEENFREYVRRRKYDPIPEYSDSWLWKITLKTAEKLNEQLFHNLQGFRAMETRLEYDDNELSLDYSESSFESRDHLMEYRKEFLLPHKEDMGLLLKKVSKFLEQADINKLKIDDLV